MMRGYLGLEKQYTGYADSKVVIVPVPFEQTTSYMQGTRRGPEAIIEASNYIEFYDEELDAELYPVGIHTMNPLLFNAHVKDDFDMITAHFVKLLDDQKFPVALGGEHSITFPIFRAFHQTFDSVSILQLDAHSDLRESYENSIYSHACVMRRISEITDRIEQVGIRAISLEEAELVKQKNMHMHYAFQIREHGFPADLIDRLAENVYITIDLDYFDPTVIPATGTPEPGGFFWDETLSFLKSVFQNRNVVGFDVVELSPIDGLVHPDFTAAKLIHKLLGYKFALKRL